jgi:hypothetical protein
MTATHVKTLVKRCLDGDTESTTGSLAAAIYSIISGGGTITQIFGFAQTNRYGTCVIVYTTAT